jgi:taurine dehydrogenase large subunit
MSSLGQDQATEVALRASGAFAPYDPQYDPLVAPNPGYGREYAPSYWVATAGPAPADDGPITSDVDADVVIIGSGFTGLACAIFLGREFGIKALVLEANRIAWGCSTRNGGQAQNASGRLTRSQWIKRWGLEVALRLHAELCDSFATFKHLIGQIDCDPQPGGHLYIAHRSRAFEKLKAESSLLNGVFKYRTEILDATAVRREYVNDAEAVGAMHEPDGIGVHPAKVAFGYVRIARAIGARVHPLSPVIRWETHTHTHCLHTPGGTVRTPAVAIATGGYTSSALQKCLTGRYFPVLSNSIVTRAMTPEEEQACSFRTRQVITDTRILRFYYRKLQDKRLQIGSRSAITGADAPHRRHARLLIDGMHRKFPPLKGIEIDYSWWGWVDVSHDMMPRVFQPVPSERVYCALGYGGNGVMYSAQAGRRMAEMVAGKGKRPDLPIYTSPLPGHPLAPFRRLGQRMLYGWYYLRDEFL